MNWLLGLLLLLSTAALADLSDKEGVMFHCALDDGTEINLERSADDRWALQVGVLSGTATVVKNDAEGIGTTFYNHREENTMVREVLIPNADRSWFYTVGVVDKGSEKSGYLQIMNNGEETVYQPCKPGTLKDEFSDTELFNKMIPAD